MDIIGFLTAFVALTFLGLLTGIVTGLSPGLHVNNVAALVLATQGVWIGFLATLSPDSTADADSAGVLLSCFLVATAASHSVFTFIPSVFLGAPTEDTALATLPGHRFLLVGQGAKAVALAGRGAVLGTALAAVALVPLRLLLGDPGDLADRFRPWTPTFLIGLLFALAVAEVRGPTRLRRMSRAVFVQGLAGCLGIATLRGGLPVDSNLILFPLFSGLFGLPSLLIGMFGPRGRIPEQRFERLRGLSRKDVRSAIRGTLAGAAVSWVPGLSGGAAATLACIGTGRRAGPSQFMIVLGAVSTSTALLSVAVLFMIHRARSGVAAVTRDLIGQFSEWREPWSIPLSLLLLTTSGVVATAVAAPLAARLARRLAGRWSRSDPRRIAAASLAAILCLLVVATGPVGVAVAGSATLLGFVPIALRVRRVHLMASLLVPVVLSYLIPLS